MVSEDGSVVFATMNEGKFFGEISLVFSCPRTASIRCIWYIHIYSTIICISMCITISVSTTHDACKAPVFF